jgi:hypothetical protein
MRKQFFSVAVILSALALLVSSAEAGGRRDKRLKVASIAVGAASTVAFFSITNWRWRSWNTNLNNGLTVGAAYAATTVGCMAVAPIVGTVVVNRPLTPREAHVMMGGCVIPFVGGWLVDQAYEANPQWEAPVRPVRAARRK